MPLSAVLDPFRAAVAAISTRALVIIGTAALCLGMATVAVALDSHTISQKGRTFNPKEITVAPGETLNIPNDDNYIHQIFVHAPNFKFDSAEMPPGDKIAVQFPAAGIYEVRCHIHPKMILLVTVK
jgi:plastocyanin